LSLSDEELERYARHIVLREVGGAGQQKLKSARVLVIGAGGLGSPLILYLAAAGIGTIGIVDHDRVALSNLQRQIAHRSEDIGIPKTASAARAAQAINPHVRIEPHACRIEPDNAADLIGAFDLVADCTDDFPTRFLIADTCYAARKPLVSAAVREFEGQLSVFKPYLAGMPCYRCLFPAPPTAGQPTCSEAGILGALAGVMGTLQALEILKEITGAGNGLAGRLLIFDAIDAKFHTARLQKDPVCACCGTPTETAER
jgi:molybdopterin-synthase adenylyltransferase